MKLARLPYIHILHLDIIIGVHVYAVEENCHRQCDFVLQWRCTYYNDVARTTMTLHVLQWRCTYYNDVARTTMTLHVLQWRCTYVHVWRPWAHCYSHRFWVWISDEKINFPSATVLLGTWSCDHEYTPMHSCFCYMYLHLFALIM